MTLPAGWRRSATSDLPDEVSAKTLTARDAVFSQLPVVCRAEVDDLWRRGQALPAAERLAVICAWAIQHQLATPWLIARLYGGIEDGASVADLADPPLFWDRAERDCHQRGAQAIVEVVGALLAQHAAVREWPILHEIAADPVNETLEQFLERAREHYAACAAVVAEARIERTPLTREQERDARWLLLHRVKRQSYASIARLDFDDDRGAADRVRKAITRLVATAGLSEANRT